MLGKALMLIHTGRAPTRSVLTSALGVTRATAGTLVSELQALHLIQVDDGPLPGPAPQGRPSHRLSVDPEGPMALAVQLHPDRFQVALLGLGSSVAAAQSRDSVIPPDPARALAEVAQVAARLMAATGRPCVGAGLAVASGASRPRRSRGQPP